MQIVMIDWVGSCEKNQIHQALRDMWQKKSLVPPENGPGLAIKHGQDNHTA